jgi:hypothetical protein
MKKLQFLSVLILFFLFSFENETKKFPAMTGVKLNDSTLTLPKDFNGKASLLILANSQKAEADLKTWQTPIYNKFIAKPSKKETFAFSAYDIHLLFVPMFTGVNQTAEGQAKKKMKEEISADMQPYFMVFKGDMKTYKDQLGMVNKDEPYLFVLDKEGNIVYQTSGAFTQAKLDAIEDNIEE